MSGTISWDGLTANKDLLYATGSTDWAKIQYIINSSDNCELRNQIGDDTTTKFTWYGNSTNLMTLQPTGSGTTISGANLSINGNITATNFNGTVNGFTLGKTVPANAVFTDTNTWRGIQDNLTSTSTSDSLSAAQGKWLNENKLSLNGGTINGALTFSKGSVSKIDIICRTDENSWAEGINMKDKDNSKRIFGMGVHGNGENLTSFFFGKGTNPWQDTIFKVTDTSILYKTYDIYHTGNNPLRLM